MLENKMPLITVFTPTYNRVQLLLRLYDSLKAQTCTDFEWLIVDDGSIDNTEAIVSEIILKQNNTVDEQLFPVRYIKKDNGGKHTAVNRGVKEAKGELFFIVDSDDILPDISIERIIFYYNQVKNNEEHCGVSGMKGFFNYQKVGSQKHFRTFDCTIAESGYKYHIRGDKAEVIRTKVMKEFPFPEFEGERFCPEALVWNRISTKYKIRYFDEIIYLCEYLEGGLTSQIAKLLERNVKATMITYKEMVENTKAPFLFRMKNAINFWRYTLLVSFTLDQKFRLKWYWTLFMPVGFMVRLLKG